MKCVIYARVSTDEQAEKGYSLPEQVRACRRYAERLEFEIAAEIRDDYTGTELERPGLQEVLELVEQGQVGAVVCLTLDRLTRKLAHSLLLRDAFRQAQVELHFTDTGLIEHTPTGRLMENIRGTFAEYERDALIERTRRGRRGKVLSGRLPGQGTPPFGYRWRGPPHDPRYAIHDGEAAVVLELFERYVGGESVRAITLDFTERRIPTYRDRLPGYKKRGHGKWSERSLYRMLRNETYAGRFYAFQNGPASERVAVEVPPIIARDLWARSQKRLERGKLLSPGNTKYEYLLIRRLRCSCGYVAGGLKGRSYRYYHCNSARLKTYVHPCDMPAFRQEPVDHTVWIWVIRVLLEPHYLEVKLAAGREADATTRQQLEERIANRRTEIDGLAVQGERLLDLLQMGEIGAERVQIRLRKLDDRRNALENEISDLETSLERQATTPAQEQTLAELVAQIGPNLRRLKFAARRSIIDLLDVRGVLAVEGDERVVYASLTLGTTITERLPIN